MYTCELCGYRPLEAEWDITMSNQIVYTDVVCPDCGYVHEHLHPQDVVNAQIEFEQGV